MSLSRLPDAKLAIMQVIWNIGSEVTSARVMERLAGKKDWATTTVLNFLARLVDRKFLNVRREGKINHYTPMVSESEYLAVESRSFLQRLHDNSFASLVASLYGGKAVPQTDLDELQQFINAKTGEQL